MTGNAEELLAAYKRGMIETAETLQDQLMRHKALWDVVSKCGCSHCRWLLEQSGNLPDFMPRYDGQT